MSKNESITQDVVTRAPFPLTVGTILEFAEALKDRPRDERIDYVKMGALGSSYLRHKRPGAELPPTSVPENIKPENVRELRTAMIASEAIRLAQDNGQTVLGLFDSVAVMHAWFDYEVKLLEQQGGKKFRVYRDRPGFHAVRFYDDSGANIGMAAFGLVGGTYNRPYDTVLADARVRGV